MTKKKTPLTRMINLLWGLQIPYIQYRHPRYPNGQSVMISSSAQTQAIHFHFEAGEYKALHVTEEDLV